MLTRIFLLDCRVHGYSSSCVSSLTFFSICCRFLLCCHCCYATQQHLSLLFWCVATLFHFYSACHVAWCVVFVSHTKGAVFAFKVSVFFPSCNMFMKFDKWFTTCGKLNTHWQKHIVFPSLSHHPCAIVFTTCSRFFSIARLMSVLLFLFFQFYVVKKRPSVEKCSNMKKTFEN